MRIVSRSLSIVPSLAVPPPSSSSSSSSSSVASDLLQQLSGLHIERCVATLQSSLHLLAAAAAAPRSSSSSNDADQSLTRGVSISSSISTAAPSVSGGPSLVRSCLRGGPESLVSLHLERQILSLSGEVAAGAAAAAAGLQQTACSCVLHRRSTALLHLCLSGAPIHPDMDWREALSSTSPLPLLLLFLLLLLLSVSFVPMSLVAALPPTNKKGDSPFCFVFHMIVDSLRLCLSLSVSVCVCLSLSISLHSSSLIARSLVLFLFLCLFHYPPSLSLYLCLSLFLRLCLSGVMQDAIHHARHCLLVLRCISMGAPLAYPSCFPVLGGPLEGPPRETVLGVPTPESVAGWGRCLDLERKKAVSAHLETSPSFNL